MVYHNLNLALSISSVALYFAVGCSRRDRMVYMYVKLIVCLSACLRVYVFQETSTV